MNLKKIKIIGIVFMFLLSFLWHFMYQWFPNNFLALITPVNESIWEHMKIIYNVLIVGSLFEFGLCRIFKVNANNKFVEVAVKSTFGVLFYLIVFIPFYLMFGDNMVFSIILMLVTYVLMDYLGYKVLHNSELNIKIMPVILIILGYILFGILTFYPRHNFLFFDEVRLGYGIIKEQRIK